MTSRSVGLQQSIRFGEDFELDLRPRRLRRGSHVLKLERIPLEILVVLLERRGEIVSREEDPEVIEILHAAICHVAVKFIIRLFLREAN